MKKTWIASFVVVILLSSFTICRAANHYILDGGTGDGSAWNNALDQFPGTFTRGDTYYVGTGSYTTPTLNTAASGTDVITIKAATVADHGTDTGWNAAYVGQATLNGVLQITTSYWTINGKFGSGEGGNPGAGTAYGFKVVPSCPTLGGTDACAPLTMYKGIDTFTSGTQKVGLLLSYMDVTACGEDHGSCNDDGFYLDNVDNSTFSHMYIHDVNRTCMLFTGGSSGNTLEYSILARRHASYPGTPHGEIVSVSGSSNNDQVFKYNRIYDGQGTGVIVIQNGTNTGWKIHGNLFYVTTANLDRYTTSGGVIEIPSGDTANNILVYGNTFSHWHTTAGVANRPFSNGTATCSGNEFRNNICFLTNQPSDCANTRSHNLYTTNSYALNDTSGQYYSGAITDLFTDPANYDFTLKAATDSGTTLASPYDKDADGITRGADGTWDRGAYEYGSTADTTAPTVSAFTIPATSYSLTVAISSFTCTDAVGVTGYLANETAEAPLPSADGWTATAPTSYQFSTTGEKTLYGWCKDGAGNVSTGSSDTVTVSQAISKAPFIIP